MYPLKIKEKYDVNNLNKLWNRFTVVYLWTYKEGDYAEYAWSHPWVDISPETPNQDTFAVLDGTVWKAWEDAAYGKYVFLEHVWAPDPENLDKTTTLYSCYQHLSEVVVQTGETVKEWQVIGKTWNTGISFWEHLHFQIDRKQAPHHAYWPYTGAEVRAAGVGFSEWVNIWLGKENAKMYTVNPLVYLDMVDQKRGGSVVKKPEKKDIVLDDILLDQIENMITNDIKNTPQPVEIVTEKSVKREEVVLKNEKDVLLASLDVENLLTPEVQKSGFRDIEKTSEYYNFLQKLVKDWVVGWFSDNTFRPLNSISRAELLKIILLAKKVDFVQDSKDYFVDIPTNAWQKKYVNTALSLGIITNKNKQFFPNEFISRVEALKMIVTLFVGSIPENYNKNFSDVKASDWFAKYVQFAAEKDLLTFSSAFQPNKKITRIEVIHILQKLS